MNTKSFIRPTIVILTLAMVLTIGCRKNVPSAQIIANETTVTAGPSPSQTTLQGTTYSDAEVASTRWIDIKDYPYDSRAQFFAGLQKLEARVDAQIQELNAKRATMNSTVDTKNWDFAMKEMGDARAYLKSTAEETHNATPEIWNQQKDKVGQAWARTQEAYDNVKHSTTI